MRHIKNFLYDKVCISFVQENPDKMINESAVMKEV